ncbi:MAG: protein kinase [Planctomycetaceae bacterium]|nr:protein kinase [Planctomycetaceae bacterium]
MHPAVSPKSSTGSSDAIPVSASLLGEKQVEALSEFFENLRRSRLMRSQAFQTMRSRVMTEGQMTAREFAESLVESGILTRWQADRLLVGKAGFQLGKYRLIDRIGAGGMAVVLKAQQKDLNRTVAIKILARTLLKRDDAMKRFFREIHAASVLEHPNIVRALDSNCIDGVPFLVMEYVEGRDLHSIVSQRGPLSIAWACEFVRQAALGLQHAYERDIIHRDIKPANLLVTRRSPADPLTVKILDFGLAKFASDTPDTGSITAAHQIFGTVDFISPEQARSARSADIRSDIFSLGCTFYYMLSGRPPFPGETAMEKLTARIADGPISIRSLRSDVPPEVEAVLLRMLARDPAARFQTPSEVAQALEPLAAAIDAAADTPLSRRPNDERTPLPAATHESELALEKFLAHLAREQTNLPESGDAIPVPAPHQSRRTTFIALAVIGIVFFLGILLFAPPLGLRDRLRAQESESEQPEPAVGSEPTEEPAPAPSNAGAETWPGESHDLLVAWHSGLEKRLTGHPFATGWGLELGTDTRFGPKGELRLQKGNAVVHGPEPLVREECRRTNEFALELQITPATIQGAGRRRIVTLSAGNRVLFVLGQQKDQLLARVETDLSGQGRGSFDVELCRLTANVPRHVLVCYRDGQLLCYANGEKISERDDVRGKLSGWNEPKITLGDNSQSRPWKGTIERFALFNQFFTLEDARARYLMSERLSADTDRNAAR